MPSASIAAASGGIFVGPVVAAARDQRRLAAFDARHQPVAVELGLEDPVAGRRRAATSVASCGSSFAGSGARTAAGRSGALVAGARLRARAPPARRAARAPRPGRAAWRRRCRAAPSTTSYSASGRAHSSRFLNSIQGSCLSPGLAMRTSSHRPASFSPCSRKSSLPLRHAFARIAHGLPGAAVPDDHRAGAVLASAGSCLRSGRSRADGPRRGSPCAFRRVEARPLGHRPAQQHAVELEAEVVVQPARPVLLDDEDRRRRARFAGSARRRRRPARTCARSRASVGSGRAAQGPCSRMRPWRREDATRPRTTSPLVGDP